MATTSEEWIQQSLTRLEQLEQERDRKTRALQGLPAGVAGSLQTEIATLDDEIRRLYAALEALADAPDEDESIRSKAPTAEYTQQANAAVNLAAESSNPFALPPGAAAPTLPGPVTVGSGAFSGSELDDYDLDTPQTGDAMKYGVLAAVVVGVVGVGGYLAMRGGGSDPATVQETKTSADGKVISSKPVPPDTQGPTAAKGKDVDRTPATEIPDGPSRSRGNTRRRSRRGSAAPAPSNRESIRFRKGSDPLSGVRK